MQALDLIRLNGRSSDYVFKLALVRDALYSKACAAYMWMDFPHSGFSVTKVVNLLVVMASAPKAA